MREFFFFILKPIIYFITNNLFSELLLFGKLNQENKFMFYKVIQQGFIADVFWKMVDSQPEALII
jgi:hypothetical protein